MAEMIATLSDACEREFGFLATRLFRVFKTEETQGMYEVVELSFLFYNDSSTFPSPTPKYIFLYDSVNVK